LVTFLPATLFAKSNGVKPIVYSKIAFNPARSAVRSLINSPGGFKGNWGPWGHAESNSLHMHEGKFERREGSRLQVRVILLDPSIEVPF
jgi:hypothetical protein